MKFFKQLEDCMAASLPLATFMVMVATSTTMTEENKEMALAFSFVATSFLIKNSYDLIGQQEERTTRQNLV